MNVFDTLFPPRSRGPGAVTGRSHGRQPGRRNRLARFSGEKLENRLALAVETPFTPVYAANLTGNISFAANTLMTAPGNSPEAIAARNGTGPANTLNDDYWNMAYVDIDSDPTTFNSSSADLVIPVGATVKFARLYWGGRCANTVPDSLLETVKFKVGAGAYTTLDGTLVGKVVGGVSNRPDNPKTYQCYADVTGLVTGAATFTVANVQGQEGAENTCNGWSLVVAYSAPGSPGEVPRNLTIFQGFADVNNNSAADRNVTIPYAGFQAPQTGPVNATLGFVTYEGDLGITGDQAFFKSQSGATETLLSDLPAIPANNFFNSTISSRGLLLTAKNRDYVNQFGFDADLVTADGIIQNGDTGAQIRVTSTQDQYYPGVITSAIDIYQPGIAVTKTVEDLNGGVVDPGDTLQYTVQVSNAAGLIDGATNVVLEDLIPANTTYVLNSLEITAGANFGTMTDPLDEDQAEFLGDRVRFQLGVGATGTQGGSLIPGDSTTVRFRVQVNPSIVGGVTITNQAVVSYVSQTFKVPDLRIGTVSIDCPAVDLKIEKTGDVPAVTAGDGVIHTFTITVTNTSTSAANNVVVADTWPAGFVPGDIVADVGTITEPDPMTGNFTWTIGTLAGNASATLIAQYTVPAGTPPGTQTNTAVVKSSTYDPNPGNNTATCETLVEAPLNLGITKLPPSRETVAGDLAPYTYLITVTNDNNFAVKDVVVTDLWPAALEIVSIVPEGGIGTVTLLPTGDFTWGIDEIPGKTSRKLTVTYTVPVGTEPTSLTTKYINTATVTSSNVGGNTVTAETIVKASLNLGITKTPPTRETVAGDLMPYTYLITVTNDNNFAVKDVVVTDLWPAALEIVSIVPVDGIGTVTLLPTGNFTWSIDEIPKNTSRSLTVTYTVPAGTPPTNPPATKYINTATVTSSNVGGNTVTAETIVKASLNLGIAKTPPTRETVAGDLVPYTYVITVTNDNAFAVKDVVVTDIWPAGLTIVSVSPSAGTVAPPLPTGSFTWSLTELPKNSFETLTVTYLVPVGTEPTSATKQYINTATVTSSNVGGNTVTAETIVTASVVLGLTKTPDVQAADSGDGVVYSYVITVTNTGVSSARNVTVFDTWPIPAGSIEQGTVTLDLDNPIGVITKGLNGDFTWTIDVLPPGEWKVTATYTVPATTPTGDYINNVQLTADGLAKPLTAFATTVVTQPTPTSDTPALILGTDDGCNVLAIVRVIDPEFGTQLTSFEPYLGFKGSVRVASGDVDRDGVSDIVVAPGRGRPGLVRVFNAAGSPLLPLGAFDFYPFGDKWRGGVEVAVGNVDGLPGNEIIAATSTGRPLVNVFSVTSSGNPTLIRSFRPFQSSYRSGAMLTAGDYGTYVNGSWSGVPDGKAEIAVGTKAGTPAQVRIFNAAPATPVLLRSFLPFGSKFRQGVTLSSARFTSDVIEDVFVGTGVGGKSQLKVFDGSGMQTGGTNAFATFFSKPNAMLFSAALDLSGGNGRVDSIYGAQGRGGVNGLPSGVGRFTGTPPVTSLGSWNAPLRIAPILIGPPTP
jgi:uncharacterized repeat protein (TIGR01451 family)